MADIKNLEYTYPKDFRAKFEDIATLMFCTELDLQEGVNRRINQEAIEADPVRIGGKCYAYQAKYYDDSTRLSDHKRDFIKSIGGAAREKVTDLFFYVNKKLPDKNHVTGEEVKYIQEIEITASWQGITIHWYTLSKIESSLDMPKYAHIKKQYFGVGKKIREYYDHVKVLYEKPNTGNELLGEESLAELYMHPSYYEPGMETGDAEQLLDKFISKGESGVLWIAGEPGHGKTSMCIKAVADYANMKRYRRVRGGVFWFRLNPQGTSGMVGPDVLALERAFSWGKAGTRGKTIDPGEIEGSLVFLDGFDELKSSLEEHCISNNRFYEQVNQLAEEYKIHIVVTSRTRALEPDGVSTENYLKYGAAEITCHLSDGGVRKNDIRLLAPLTAEEQIAWIEALLICRKDKGGDTSQLELYKQRFRSLQKNEDIKGLLEVPILLRMIVQNCFEPSSENRVSLYRELFKKTMLRQGLEGQLDDLHSIYREIAFRIFANDDDSAEFKKGEFKKITGSNAYLYRYYLHTPEEESQQGKADRYCTTFLHRSFYQYFLSEYFYEILKNERGEEFLKCLWARHLDPYVQDNLRIMAKDEDLDCAKVFKAIDETDCFFLDYKYLSDSKEPIGNLDKANNVFWNAVSACNRIFQNTEPQERMRLTETVLELLTRFRCSGISLRRSMLNNADLRGAYLLFADLGGADLSGADLRGVDLNRADVGGVNMRGARLERADLREVHMSGADLRKADLCGADLRKADLSGADLSEAYLGGANLEGACLNGSNLRGADLIKADLIEADLRGTDLRKASMDEVDLRRVDLSGAYLNGADLSKARLSGSVLSGADLSSAFLSGTELFRANLSRANLKGARLREADLRKADLSKSDLGGANLEGACLSEADLNRADLRDAYLSKADLSRAKLSDANLRGANLNGADLRGTKMNGADLRGADLSDALLDDDFTEEVKKES